MSTPNTGIATEKKSLSPIVASFELSRVRCEAEVALYAAVENNPDFFGRLSSCTEGSNAALVEGRLSLIKNSYRVDPTLTPHLHKLAETLRAILRLVQPLDVYVVANPELNAFCLPSRKGTRLVMCLHSSLLDPPMATSNSPTYGHPNSPRQDG